jgi:hypothetical protein
MASFYGSRDGNSLLLRTGFGFLIGALSLASFAPRAVLGADWRGIIPARSGKETVKARLGKPSQEAPDRMEFENKSGKTTIFFYTEQDTQSLKLAPQLAGKVLTIYYYPKKPAKYDLKALAKKVVAVGHGVTMEGEPMTSYDDGEHGISYHFKRDDPHVWRLVYYAPRAEFAKYRLSTADDHDR